MKNEITNINNFNVKNAQESFFEYLDCNELTLRSYRVGVENFIEYLNKYDIKNPTRLDFKRYRDELKGVVSTNTINSYMTAIRQFFKYLSEYGIYENITRDVKNVKTAAISKTQVLNQEQCKEIYKSLTDPMEKCLFGLAISTGMRANEIAHSKIENIKMYNGEYVLFHICKKRDDESEYNKLSNQVLADILNYIGDRTSGYIFVSRSNRNNGQGVTNKTIRTIIKSIFKRFGIDQDWVSCHTLRKTSATLAYMNGQSIYDIQQYLHHRSISSSARYIKQITRDTNQSESIVSDLVLG